MRAALQKPVFLLALVAMVPLWYGVGYHLDRTNFKVLVALFAALFGLYALVCSQIRDGQQFWIAIGFALGYRLLLLPGEPFLSDDVYRFLWDGRLLAQGMDPFAHTPRWFIEHPEVRDSLQGIGASLFEKLNSPDYYTVYPPFCQAVFSFTGWLFPESITGGIIAIRSLVIGFEGLNLYLLYRLIHYLCLPYSRVLLYALNPLVIAELTGNLHFEAFMITFLLAALGLLIKRYWQAAGALFSVAVLAKLLPLVFLPGLIKRIGWIKTLFIGFVALFCLVGGFVAVSSPAQLTHMLQSVGLYFQTFEFNASIYYLLRWVGFQWQGYNMISTIGPALAALTATGVFAYALKERHPSLHTWPVFIIFSYTIYLFMATTVHPWYVTLIIAFGVLTSLWFPLVWSFTVMLSYSAYQPIGVQESLLWITIEYTAVTIAMVYDLLVARKSSNIIPN